MTVRVCAILSKIFGSSLTSNLRQSVAEQTWWELDNQKSGDRKYNREAKSTYINPIGASRIQHLLDIVDTREEKKEDASSSTVASQRKNNEKRISLWSYSREEPTTTKLIIEELVKIVRLPEA